MMRADTTNALSARQRLRERLLAGGTGKPSADRDGGDPSRMTVSQRRLWWSDRMGTNPAAYLVPIGLTVRGVLDVAALRAAVADLVARHEPLRTRYVERDGAPVAVVDPPAPAALPMTDLSAAPPDGRAARIADLLAGLRRPLDLAHGPVLRGHLVRVGDQEHVVLFVVHHIAFDGWSAPILTRDLLAMYEARRTRRRGERPELPITFSDYAAGQSSVPAASAAYWSARLAGLDPLDLPTDRPRPPVFDSTAGRTAFRIDGAVAAAVARLARQTRSTPYAVFLAAFQVFLARHAGTADVAVGVPLSGRADADTHDLIGYFVNPVVIRTLVPPDASFRQVVAATREEILAAYEHQRLPFEELTANLPAQRDPSRTPLFQAMFTMHDGADAPSGAAGLTVEPYPVGWPVARCDLSLGLTPALDGSYDGELLFPAGLFTDPTTRRMAQRYVELLTNATARPLAELSTVEMAPPDERRQVAATAVARVVRPVTGSLTERFAAVVRSRPDAVAVSDGAEEVSYADLDAASRRLAARLVAAGVCRGDVVGVQLRRGTWAVVAFLAVLRAGAAYLPLDPDYPPDRLGFLVSDAGAAVVVTTTELVDGVPGGAVPVLVDQPADGPVGALPVLAHPDDVAYVIYTSGSTGRPKGVAVTHRNVLRLFAAAAAEIDFGVDDVWSWFHSPSFDFSVWEIWGALLHGGRLVVVPADVARSPEDVARLLARTGVTMLSQTPTAFRGLSDHLVSGGPPGAGWALRAVVFGGEALHPSDLRAWFDWGADRTPAMINMYGITETTVHVTIRRIRPADADDARSLIGRPLDDLAVVLLDRDLRPVPVGSPGEMYVGGGGVANGYLGRPALTADRFVPDPFGPPGARLYRSGDLARLTAEGELEYLGRRDGQVKIRGHRIELAEVEHALRGHPAVAAAAVVVSDGRLVAYAVATPAGGLDPHELRRHAARHLPGHMVPAVVVPLDDLPLTGNGKLDRAALPAPDRAAGVDGADHEPPVGPVETAVARAWETALDRSAIGRHDNFFGLGGDSIRAVRAVGALKQAGLPASVRQLFLHQSVAELAAALDVGGGSDDERGEDPVPPFAMVGHSDRVGLPGGVDDAYPMSLVQAGMVYEMLADPDRLPYHNVTCYFVPEAGPGQPEHLMAAAQDLAGRHEVLRTSFAVEGFSEPLQIVHSSVRVPVGVHDLGTDERDVQLAALEDFRARERAAAIPPEHVPQFRLHMHRGVAAGWWLSLTESHAILDGWSHTSFVAELVRTYRRRRGEAVPVALTPPSARFADFVAAERAVSTGSGSEQFWLEQVTAYAKAELPGVADAADAAVRSHRLELDVTDLVPGLHRLADAARAPVKSVLLAAHLEVVGALTGHRRFHTGLVSNGRPESAGADRVLGMHLNTVPFAIDLDRVGRTWTDLVRSVFAQEIQVWPHRRYPMPLMRKRWGNGRPLIDIAFTYLDFHSLDRSSVDETAILDDSPTEFPMTVSTQGAGHLLISVRSDRLSGPAAERLRRMYRTVLARMAADPDGPAWRSPLPEEDRADVLRRSAVVSRPVADDQTIPGVVLAQALRTPQACAMVQGDIQLSYADLARRMTTVAGRLRERGVRPETVVAVALPRGIDQAVCALGVMLAGGVHLPVDPDYPEERLRFMLTDAGARWIVGGDDGLSAAVPIAYRALAAGGDGAPLPPVDPDSLAYLIYTSGSTGRPKAVGVPHRGPVNLAGVTRELFGAGVGDRILQFSSPSFDLSVWETLAALTTGATLVYPPVDPVGGDALLDPATGIDRLTHVALTPSALDRLDPEAMPRLRVCVSGAEVCPPALAARWAGRVRFVNAYGPTETSVCATVAPVDPPVGDQPLPIGRPLDNLTAHVLSADLEPVVPGVAGELHIGGVAVVRGYLGRPAATAAAFVPDPHGDRPGARLYRTGDIVRADEDGRLTFVGRRDGQVKVRGHRVEVGEVEAALAGLPGVRAVAVRLHTGRLVAYLVPTDPAAPPTDDVGRLRTALAERLPDYMVPTSFQTIAELPVAVNGKVDRAALPAPAGERPRLREEFVAPRSPLQAAFAAAWAEALGLERVGVRDDFFALGGDSLGMTRVIVRLRRERQVALSFADFFRHRTIERITGSLAGKTDAGTALVRLSRTGSERPLFCVHPVGGSAHWFVELAGALAPSRPVGAFEWPGLSGPGTAVADLPALARRYAAELTESPCDLLGWCTGSALAVELARVLRAGGTDVRLFLVDPVLDVRSHGTFRTELAALEAGGRVTRELAATDDPAHRARLRRQLAGHAAVVFGPDFVRDHDDVAALGQLVEGLRQLFALHATYEPPRSAGDLHLVLSDDVAGVIPGGAEGEAAYLSHWRAASAGRLTVHRITGDHYGVWTRPHVLRIAEAITGPAQP